MGGCETTPPDSRTDPREASTTANNPVHGKPQPSRLSSLAIMRRRLLASSSFLLAAARLRGLQLDPRPRGGTETSSYEDTQHNSQPGADQVTGPVQHALLTAKAPMGGCSAMPTPGEPGLPEPPVLGDLAHPEDGYQRSVMCLTAWLITNAGAGLGMRMRRGNSLISAAWPRFAARVRVTRGTGAGQHALVGCDRLWGHARRNASRSTAPACPGWLGSLGVSWDSPVLLCRSAVRRPAG